MRATLKSISGSLSKRLLWLLPGRDRDRWTASHAVANTVTSMTKNVTRPFVLADGIPTTLELLHSCMFILKLANWKTMDIPGWSLLLWCQESHRWLGRCPLFTYLATSVWASSNRVNRLEAQSRSKSTALTRQGLYYLHFPSLTALALRWATHFWTW